jgi:FecR-like protein
MLSKIKLFIISLGIVFFIDISLFAIHVDFFRGDVKIKRSGKSISVNIKDILNSGDIIITGKRSSIVIKYDDQSKITINSNSKAKVGNLKIKGSSNISIFSGSLSGKYSKLRKGSRKIYSPTTVAAIRGTEFTIGVSRSGKTNINLSEGKLDINNPYGRSKLNSGENASIKIADKPKIQKGDIEVEKALKKEDKKFKKNSNNTARRYVKYMSKFKQRSTSSNKNIKGYNKQIKSSKSKSDFARNKNKIDRAEEDIEDDLMLNDAANESINLILEGYSNSRSKIYQKFFKVKMESNKVREQQERNHQDIMAVKKAYLEAYEKIMGQFKKDKDDILGNDKFDNIKPEIEKY